MDRPIDWSGSYQGHRGRISRQAGRPRTSPVGCVSTRVEAICRVGRWLRRRRPGTPSASGALAPLPAQVLCCRHRGNEFGPRGPGANCSRQRHLQPCLVALHSNVARPAVAWSTIFAPRRVRAPRRSLRQCHHVVRRRRFAGRTRTLQSAVPVRAFALIGCRALPGYCRGVVRCRVLRRPWC